MIPDIGLLFWATLYFQALNGVKQGGVIRPVLFCIYTLTIC